jgi:uncharacterized membrane-anchored protein YhcB (DUF1043 family)
MQGTEIYLYIMSAVVIFVFITLVLNREAERKAKIQRERELMPGYQEEMGRLKAQEDFQKQKMQRVRDAKTQKKLRGKMFGF